MSSAENDVQIDPTEPLQRLAAPDLSVLGGSDWSPLGVRDPRAMQRPQKGITMVKAMPSTLVQEPALVELARDRVNLLGTLTDRVERSALPEWIESFVTSRQPHQIITVNLHFLAIARKLPEFCRIIENADLVVCDGKPLQWAARIQGNPIPARITGMDLVLTTAHLSAQHGYRIFFLGAEPGIADRAARRLEQLVPGVTIAGTYSPTVGAFDEVEDRHIVDQIRAASPDALFVALGAPRQDEWIRDHLDELGVPVCAGIGGVFNFLAGETRRAPDWIQGMGMEWAFRLLQEPRRLWRRYLVDDLPLCFALFTQQALARLHPRRTHRVEPTVS